MKKKSKHELTLDLLVKRLKPKGYEWMMKHWKYHVNHLHGELDLITYRSTSNCVHYYEIKSTDSAKNYSKAAAQLLKVQKAFPEIEFKGIYVTPTGVRRLLNLEWNPYKK